MTQASHGPLSQEPLLPVLCVAMVRRLHLRKARRHPFFGPVAIFLSLRQFSLIMLWLFLICSCFISGSFLSYNRFSDVRPVFIFLYCEISASCQPSRDGDGGGSLKMSTCSLFSRYIKLIHFGGGRYLSHQNFFLTDVAT